MEVVAELNDFVRRVARTYRGIDPREIHVVLLEIFERILPDLGEKLRLRAEKVLGTVQELAGPVVREVTLLRVVDGPDEGSAVERYLDAVAQRLQGAGLVCGRQVEQGDPAQVIIDVAGTDKLVVMATHGRSGLTRWALASVPDRVARHGATAVLLVRACAAVPETQ